MKGRKARKAKGRKANSRQAEKQRSRKAVSIEPGPKKQQTCREKKNSPPYCMRIVHVVHHHCI
jgi:hypothetical protein